MGRTQILRVRHLSPTPWLFLLYLYVSLVSNHRQRTKRKHRFPRILTTTTFPNTGVGGWKHRASLRQTEHLSQELIQNQKFKDSMIHLGRVHFAINSPSVSSLPNQWHVNSTTKDTKQHNSREFNTPAPSHCVFPISDIKRQIQGQAIGLASECLQRTLE